MREYDFSELEPRWRRYWEEQGTYRARLEESERKLYCLVMFSYPSGDKLHIGHWYNFGPTDTWARFKRLQGYNVFEPMGFDAFGLPAENYAVKTGIHPSISTASNIGFIRQQLREMGAMYDWEYEVDTSHPDYYKWTQWIFLQLYKNGLAYKRKAPVNWCPSCMTVLANEQVKDGECERCSAIVVQKDLEQWFFKTTDYADRLLEGLERIQWPEKTKIMQRNWIGKSYGAEIDFDVAGQQHTTIRVFTTRPDTLMGVTYVVLAPEHPLVALLMTPAQRDAVLQYQESVRRMNEIERVSAEKEKTGVFLGAFAIHPISGEKVPIWIADYVLASYGTGAVMAVPAHDTRDYEFAQKFSLPIKIVIMPEQGEAPSNEAFTQYGVMRESGRFDGLSSAEGIRQVAQHLEEIGKGKAAITYRLRDWLVSRQRYWGAPIPIIYCEHCGALPVPEDQLPVRLPEDVDFRPKGQSPLATSESFLHTVCPQCGGPAQREVDTMDTFVCSSWYYLRYVNPRLADKAFDSEMVNRWLPVDQYVGGAEHACMHLLYARFFTKVLYDLKYLNFDEPFTSLVHQGTITRNGAKMSKSRGNVVNPDDYIRQYGSDTFRCYMMFMGSYEDGGDWDDSGLQGVHRFVQRVWRLAMGNDATGIVVQDDNLTRKLHQTIKKVGEDVEKFHFNTAIAALMEMVNACYAWLDKHKNGNLSEYLRPLVLLVAPFAPHLAEELWRELGGKPSLFTTACWPEYNPALLLEDMITVVVQVNGKLRGKLEVSRDIEDHEIKEMALQEPNVVKYINGKTAKKIVYVPQKLVSIVV